MTARRFSLLCALVAGTFPAVAGAADPPRLAGNWTWSWKSPDGQTHRHVLEVEGLATKLAARERFDDQEPVRVADLKLEGKQVRFSVVRGEKRAEYSGVIAADDASINGTVKVTTGEETSEFVWKATRELPSGQPVPE